MSKPNADTAKTNATAKTATRGRGRPKGAKTGTGSVYQHKDKDGKPYGNYYATVYVNGKPTVRSLNTTNKREAERRRAEWVARAQRQAAPTARGNGPIYAGHVAISAAWDSFEPFAQNMTPRLRAQYLADFKRFAAWADARGIANAEDVTQADAVRYLNETGKGSTINSTSKTITHLSRVFAKCPAGVNPFADIPSNTGATADEAYYGPLTDAEVERLFESAAKMDERNGTDEWLLMFQIAAFTGLRREDIALLRWGSVHLEGDTPVISLVPAKTAKKTGRIVNIPIIEPPLLSALRAKRAKAEAGEPVTPATRTRKGYLAALGDAADALEYVLPGIAKIYRDSDAGRGSRLADTLRNIFDGAGVSRARYRDPKDGNLYKKSFHSFRVRMVSKLANAGCPITLATTIMGHDRKMFLRYFREDTGAALVYIRRAFWGWDQTGRTETLEEAAQH